MIKQRLTHGLITIFGEWVVDVNTRTLRSDATAGLLGAVLVLPQAIAFAMLAGLPPQYGLYTAIIPCIIAALFGSSRHVMSGPTNANSLALFAMLTPIAIAGSPHYIQLALIVTILVGLIQAGISILKMGTLANFISPAVLKGFTSGAAILIALHAIGGSTGLTDTSVHGAIATFTHYIGHWDQIQFGTLTVALCTGIAALLVKQRLSRRWPFMLIGLAAGAILGALLNLLPEGSLFTGIQQVGRIPSPWPSFEIPSLDWGQLPDLISIAIALSIVSLGQSISIAKSLGVRSGQLIDPNREFLGQGLSNIVGGFFSSYVSCGSFNRSLPNLEAGAKTPLSSVFSALLLIVLILLFHRLLAYLPVAGISALLVLVAWSLIEFPQWRLLWQQQRSEFLIAAATASATVLLRMEMAIFMGALLSLMLYLNRTSKPAVRLMGFLDKSPNRHMEDITSLKPADQAMMTCPQLDMIRMEGDVYFGATAHVFSKLSELRQSPHAPKNLLVMSRSMNFVDLSGARMWEQERQARKKMGGDLYFHRPRNDVLKMWQRTKFIRHLGDQHIFITKEAAISHIFKQLDREICLTCKSRIFRECAQIPGPFEPGEVPENIHKAGALLTPGAVKKVIQKPD
ncbi:SulP family inorganic anion transporter [Orrella sp. 11846]|uniref:SulP family inorganic anion transporter n=1 Tax=Orrella sp. 11846 TaxID=3409913 RepID=UPI003B5BA860